MVPSKSSLCIFFWVWVGKCWFTFPRQLPYSSDSLDPILSRHSQIDQLGPLLETTDWSNLLDSAVLLTVILCSMFGSICMRKHQQNECMITWLVLFTASIHLTERHHNLADLTSCLVGGCHGECQATMQSSCSSFQRTCYPSLVLMPLFLKLS